MEAVLIPKLNDSVLSSVNGGLNTAKHVWVVDCTDEGCSVRSTPRAKDSFNVIGNAYLGDTFPLLGLENSWAKVRYRGGIAYIHESRVRGYEK